MFKEFWDRKRHIVEATSIIVALGTLFLTIQPPNDPQARTALFYLQFLWLLLISVALFALGVNAAQLVYDMERTIDAKYGPFTEGVLSALVLLVTAAMIAAIWLYMLVLYRDQALIVFGVSDQSFQVLLFSAYVFFQWRVEARFQSRLLRRVLAHMGLFAAFVVVSDTATQVAALRVFRLDSRRVLQLDTAFKALSAVVVLLLYHWRVRRIAQRRETDLGQAAGSEKGTQSLQVDDGGKGEGARCRFGRSA